MENDTETTKELSDSEHIRLMSEGRGWGLVRASLVERILDLQNINNIDMGSPETMTVDLKARKMAAALLFDWLKADVEGRVEQGANAQEALKDKPEDSYIERLPE